MGRSRSVGLRFSEGSGFHAGFDRRGQLDSTKVPRLTMSVAQQEGNDDSSLVLRAARGDHSAFETLLRRHRGTVLRVARRLTTDADAEDVTQQTFLKAFANLSSFRFRSTFRTWLVSIALNEARMWNRKARRHRELSLFATDKEEDSPQMFDCPDSGRGPEMRYSDEERSQILNSAISQLRPLERAAIRTCDLEEVPLAEAANLFGTSVSALKSRRIRGRASLRELLMRHLQMRPLVSP